MFKKVLSMVNIYKTEKRKKKSKGGNTLPMRISIIGYIFKIKK